jgi:carboxymethylenebutenolidase
MSDNDGKMVQLTAADGFKLDAFEVAAVGASRGSIVILQEIFGVTDQLRGVARFYAKQGYDAMVPALYDRTSPKTVVPFAEIERARSTMLALDKDKVMVDIAAAVRHMDHGKGVSVVGFCWGGGLALRAAGPLALRSATSFYGTELRTHLANKPKCPMLFHFGRTDAHSPPEVIADVQKAIPSAETHVYEAGHGFANDQRPTVYEKDAAELAHQRTVAFLNKAHPK